MSLIKITTHVEDAQNRLVQQYKESPNFNNLLKSLILPVQEIEGQVDDVYRLRSIVSAAGIQLDSIGGIVGELRVGRSDQVYRNAIINRISINTAGGEPESIINAIKQIHTPTTINYYDLGNAEFQLFIQIAPFVANLPQLVQSISPAGVGSIVTQGNNELPFVFGEISSAPFDFVVQSGSFHNDSVDNLEVDFDILNSYNLDIETETTIDDVTGDGFAEVYLNDALLLVDGFHYNIGDGDILQLSLSDANEDYTISEFGGELIEVIQT